MHQISCMSEKLHLYMLVHLCMCLCIIGAAVQCACVGLLVFPVSQSTCACLCFWLKSGGLDETPHCCCCFAVSAKGCTFTLPAA